MNPSDFKFTLYDIISYTFCGAISLILFRVVIEIKDIILPDSDFSKYLLKLISLDDVISFIVVSYFIGKIISALSSIIFEKIILGQLFKKFYKLDKVDSHISGKLFETFRKKFIKLYQSDYSEKHWRLITTYVEENRSAAYSTAFTFLSYYGMSRNFMLIFLVTLLFLINTHLFIAAFAFVLFLVEIYEYHRFRKYFHQQIIFAFLTDKEISNHI
jgi:hypothetical protein